jgi:hypothetical protein
LPPITALNLDQYSGPGEAADGDERASRKALLECFLADFPQTVTVTHGVGGSPALHDKNLIWRMRLSAPKYPLSAVYVGAPLMRGANEAPVRIAPGLCFF